MANSVFTDAQINEILNIFRQNMGHRQYIGARYVPIFGRVGETSIEWDNTGDYEPLTIVLNQGNSFTSRQYVPVGIDINDTRYWANTGNFNAQVEQYRQEVLNLSDEVDDFNSEIERQNNNFNAVHANLEYISTFEKISASQINHGMQGGAYFDNKIALGASSDLGNYVGVYSLDTGALLYGQENALFGHCNTISHDGQYIYVLGDSTVVYKCNANTLTVIESIDLSSFMSYSHLYFAFFTKDYIYIVNSDVASDYTPSELAQIDRATNTKINTYEFDFKNNSAFFFNIYANDERVYLGMNNGEIKVFTSDLTVLPSINFSNTINGQYVYEFEFITADEESLIIGGIDYTGGLKLIGRLNIGYSGRSMFKPAPRAVTNYYYSLINADATIAFSANEDGSTTRPFSSLTAAMAVANNPDIVTSQVLINHESVFNDGIYILKPNIRVVANQYGKTNLVRLNTVSNIYFRKFFPAILHLTASELTIENSGATQNSGIEVTIDRQSKVTVYPANIDNLTGYNGGTLEFVSPVQVSNGLFVTANNVEPAIVGNSPKNICCKIPGFTAANSIEFNVCAGITDTLNMVIYRNARNLISVPMFGNSVSTVEDTQVRITRTQLSKEVVIYRDDTSEQTVQVPYIHLKVETVDNSNIQDIVVMY